MVWEAWHQVGKCTRNPHRLVNMKQESEFVAHEPCSNCGSSDANSVYSDGHKFCFSCQTYTPAEDWTHTHTQMNNDERVQFLGSAEQLQKRRISEATNSFYRIYRHGNTSASHIIMKAAKLLDSKLNQKRKTFITKVEEQINSLDSIFSPPPESE